MLALTKNISFLHVALHSFFFLVLIFFRFYPGPDYSRSLKHTFDVKRLALGWFETWSQWSFWASLVYYMYAAVVDILEASKWRRQRDIFFALVLSSSLSVLAGYWAVQIPAGAGLGFKMPAHSNWEEIAENYVLVTVPPVMAFCEFLLVSHRPGNFFVELILVSIFCLGFIVTDIARYSLTHTFIYPIQHHAYGAYWAILGVVVFLSFAAYRGLAILILSCRRATPSCGQFLYDSDAEDESIETRRRLINEDFGATLRYGRTDGRSSDSCFKLSIPAISM